MHAVLLLLKEKQIPSRSAQYISRLLLTDLETALVKASEQMPCHGHIFNCYLWTYFLDP